MKIKNIVESLEQIADDDLLIIWDTSEDRVKKVAASVIKNYIGVVSGGEEEPPPPPPVSYNLTPYTATAAETYTYLYYAPTTYNLAKINDGNSTVGVVKQSGGTFNTLKLICSFASALRINRLKIWTGQFNGDYHYPRNLKVYRGTQEIAANLLIEQGLNYDLNTIELADNTNFSTSSTDYLLVFNNTNYGESYVSIKEIEFYG